MDALAEGRLPDGDLSPAVLIRQAMMRWRFLGAGLGAGVLVALMAAHLITPRYTAQMVVGPVARTGPAGMGPQAPTLMASAGKAVSEPGAGNELLSDYTRFLRILGSVKVAARLAEQPGLMPGLFPAGWDAERATWEAPMTPTALLRRAALAMAGRQGWTPPDARTLADHLRHSLRIEPLGGGPMQRISYRHGDRALALAVVSGVHRAADRAIRDEALRRIGAQIAFLTGRLDAVTQADHRRALVALLAEQDRLRMLIDVELPFAADLIEPVTAPAVPDWPDPLVLLPMGGLAGFMLALFVVYAGMRPVGPARHGAG